LSTNPLISVSVVTAISGCALIVVATKASIAIPIITSLPVARARRSSMTFSIVCVLLATLLLFFLLVILMNTHKLVSNYIADAWMPSVLMESIRKVFVCQRSDLIKI